MFQFRDEAPKVLSGVSVFVVIAASIFYAWNLRCFAKTAGLFPGIFGTFPVVTGNRTGLFRD